MANCCLNDASDPCYILVWYEVSSLLSDEARDARLRAPSISECMMRLVRSLARHDCQQKDSKGPLTFLATNDPFNRLLVWTIRHRDVLRQMTADQLKMFCVVLASGDERILTSQQVLEPLVSLLLSLRPTDKRKMPEEFELEYVSLLLRLTTLLHSNSSEPLLSTEWRTSQGVLVPPYPYLDLICYYLHSASMVGALAREAFMNCMMASKLNSAFAMFIVTKSPCCQLLAAGLSGSYASLPLRISLDPESWFIINDDKVAASKEIQRLLENLELCCKVVQLVPEHQCLAILYLELMLRHITHPLVMKSFLQFIMLGSQDSIMIIDMLTSLILSPNTQLCMSVLSLFKTLVGMNCEDVMVHLVLKYLTSCRHVLPHQKQTIKSLDFYCANATMFVLLLPKISLDIPLQHLQQGTELFSSIESANSTSLDSAVPVEVSGVADLLDAIHNHRFAVISFRRSCACWSTAYDGTECAVCTDVTQLSTVQAVGPFMANLLERLQRIPENTLLVNIHLTSLASLLACYPQPLLRSYLLSAKLIVMPGVNSIRQVLTEVVARVEAGIRNVHDLPTMINRCRNRVRLLLRRLYTCERSSELFQDFDPDHFSDQKAMPVSLPTSPGSSSQSSAVVGRLHPLIGAKPQSPRKTDPEQLSGFAHTTQLGNSLALLESWIKDLAAISLIHCSS